MRWLAGEFIIVTVLKLELFGFYQINAHLSYFLNRIIEEMVLNNVRIDRHLADDIWLAHMWRTDIWVTHLVSLLMKSQYTLNI